MNQLVYTVTELTKNIKNALETNPYLSSIWVKGEISNLTLHSSGHIYFSLKDENSVISATFFKSANRVLNFKLEEGMSVIAFGSLSVFEKRGSYQLNVAQVKLEGIGELQKRIDQLKKKLAQEGIFDQSRKKELPFLPKRIGVVTSPTGAAVRDIIKVAFRRFPNIEVVIAPAKVQGDDSVVSIVRAIEELNRPEHRIDVIIAGRGGGSFEDLMAFNEEPVVRAFADSNVPVISAVGHQIDHPLSDDAADHFAPTPSAAAEIAVPLKSELVSEIDYFLNRAMNSLISMQRDYKTRFAGIMNRRIFRNPFEIVNIKGVEFYDIESRIINSMKQMISSSRNRLLQISDINSIIVNYIQKCVHRYHMALSAIEKLSPISVMKRGYTVTMSAGKIVKSAKEIRKGDEIAVRLHDGNLECTVNKISMEK